jgi:hypothetical protein
MKPIKDANKKVIGWKDERKSNDENQTPSVITSVSHPLEPETKQTPV